MAACMQEAEEEEADAEPEPEPEPEAKKRGHRTYALMEGSRCPDLTRDASVFAGLMPEHDKSPPYLGLCFEQHRSRAPSAEQRQSGWQTEGSLPILFTLLMPSIWNYIGFRSGRYSHHAQDKEVSLLYPLFPRSASDAELRLQAPTKPLT
ncbi:hypothetical protein MGYG_03697 [Nannizzia gypsea CBS 118893]|uniref:Uncharacterized protein n=1 Tax=Arthroderma gypseum (strain ATCC MYA-4604 / CBS 118893) TaxID=535722 RepID=E4UTD1_ARTGP|nr:hypothetical protein MGYG_03697 [Nannizzia gypsea CBS 118893]EFR00692.1 hypothetical protein MGYG_03697 [Nannizzia gypsea CBS 118893]